MKHRRISVKRRGIPSARLKELSIIRLIPNMVTVLGLCAGVTAIRFALGGNWEAAVAAILVASFLDLLDGGMARLLGAGSSFGAELDSLADLVSFGVAPAVILYAWTLDGAGSVGWALALMFCVCCALRLARFNTALDDEEQPPWAFRYFTGLPTPAAAGFVLLPMVLSFQFPAAPFDAVAVNGALVVVVSLLMIGRLPTYSVKRLRISNKLVVPVMLAACLLAAFVVGSPWATLTVLLVVYFASLPFSYVTYRRLERSMARAANDESESDAVPASPVDDPESIGART